MIRNAMIAGAAGALLSASAASAQILDLTWRTIDGGGGISGGEGFMLEGTVGQFDAGVLGGLGYDLTGGFWPGIGIRAECYANCDGSTTQPVLNVSDFICFQTLFASASPAANCDGSTTQPVLNVSDFICFQQKFAAGCP